MIFKIYENVDDRSVCIFLKILNFLFVVCFCRCLNNLNRMVKNIMGQCQMAMDQVKTSFLDQILYVSKFYCKNRRTYFMNDYDASGLGH